MRRSRRGWVKLCVPAIVAPGCGRPVERVLAIVGQRGYRVAELKQSAAGAIALRVHADRAELANAVYEPDYSGAQAWAVWLDDDSVLAVQFLEETQVISLPADGQSPPVRRQSEYAGIVAEDLRALLRKNREELRGDALFALRDPLRALAHGDFARLLPGIFAADGKRVAIRDGHVTGVSWNRRG